MKTTLNKIREHKPCTYGWEKLLKSLGKTKADDEPLSLITVLDSNGLDDALWCLRALDNYEKEMRLYAVWCARQVQHLMRDKRSLDAIDIAERFANGAATWVELDAAVAAARDAAWDAVRDAAWVAVAAARDAAWDAARDAAWAAAWAASGDTAWDAACDAVRAAQEVKFREIFGVGDGNAKN